MLTEATKETKIKKPLVLGQIGIFVFFVPFWKNLSPAN